MPSHEQTSPKPVDSAKVLTTALLRASHRLDFQQKQLALVLGVSAASLSRLAQGRSIRPETKEGELAILFVRLFRSLDTLLGGNQDANRQWFHAHNEHLGGIPAELIRTVQGLVHVVEYLDAMRGKLKNSARTCGRMESKHSDTFLHAISRRASTADCSRPALSPPNDRCSSSPGSAWPRLRESRSRSRTISGNGATISLERATKSRECCRRQRPS